MRTEKELWQVVLANQDLFETGLCKWIVSCFHADLLTKEEYDLLDDVIYANTSAASINSSVAWLSPYCWQVGIIEHRIEWITNRINDLA